MMKMKMLRKHMQRLRRLGIQIVRYVSFTLLIYQRVLIYIVTLTSKVCQTSRKNDRTADLRTIFSEEKGHVNVDTGTSEDGWWCNVCRYVDVAHHALLLNSKLTGLYLGMRGCPPTNHSSKVVFLHVARTFHGEYITTTASKRFSLTNEL